MSAPGNTVQGAVSVRCHTEAMMLERKSVVGSVAVAAIAVCASAASGQGSGPRFGSIAIRSGFSGDPRTVQVTLGGTRAASSLRAGCAGFVGARPDLVMNLQSASSWMRIYVRSSADTSLVVRRPDGSVSCNNDAFGSNPAIAGAFGAGRYTIWVAGPGPDDGSSAQVSFTELQGNHP